MVLSQSKCHSTIDILNFVPRAACVQRSDRFVHTRDYNIWCKCIMVIYMSMHIDVEYIGSECMHSVREYYVLNVM